MSADKQSRDSREAMEAFDAHGESAAHDDSEAGVASAIPGDEHGAHARSHAAHLDTAGHVKTSAHEEVGQQAREPGAERQPPQDPARSGKGRHRE